MEMSIRAYGWRVALFGLMVQSWSITPVQAQDAAAMLLDKITGSTSYNLHGYVRRTC